MKTIYCIEIFRIHFKPLKKLPVIKYGKNNVTFIQDGKEVTIKRVKFMRHYRFWDDTKARPVERQTKVIKNLPKWVGKEF